MFVNVETTNLTNCIARTFRLLVIMRQQLLFAYVAYLRCYALRATKPANYFAWTWIHVPVTRPSEFLKRETFDHLGGYSRRSINPLQLDNILSHINNLFYETNSIYVFYINSLIKIFVYNCKGLTRLKMLWIT